MTNGQAVASLHRVSDDQGLPLKVELYPPTEAYDPTDRQHHHYRRVETTLYPTGAIASGDDTT